MPPTGKPAAGARRERGSPRRPEGKGGGTGREDSGILPPPRPFFPSKSPVPHPGPSWRQVAEAGSARDRGCEVWEGAACRIELASAAAAAASRLFPRKEALRPPQPGCQHGSRADLGGDVLRRGPPRRTQCFSCAGTGNALGTEFPWVCAQSPTSGTESPPAPWKTRGCPVPPHSPPCPRGCPRPGTPVVYVKSPSVCLGARVPSPGRG